MFEENEKSKEIKKEEEQDQNFRGRVSHCEKNLWSSGSIFYIRIAKCFHL